MVDTRQFAHENDRNALGIEGALQQNAILQNRYRIEAVLGVGGMGSVYKARDLQFPDARRYVAVKEMLHHTNDEKLRDMSLKNFRREANILAGLNHPAIPTIHDYFATKERAYLVMEYIEGQDLDNILSNTEDFVDVTTVIEWGINLCDVLSYLHNSVPPIIFRDVKPSNLMIDSRGRLRLIDFGIAKLFEPETKGTMIGTEGYAAPESYRGQANPLSDIFGVGATLHHILTRHDPRLEAPFTFGERPIRDTNPAVPVALDSIVMKALAFNPEERFQSAEEMKSALTGVIAASRSVIPSDRGTSIISGTPGTTVWEDIDNFEGGNVEPRWIFKAEEEIRSMPVVHKGVVYVTVYDNNCYAVDAETGQLKWKFAAEGELASSPAISDAEGLVLFGSKDYSLYAVDIRTGRIRWTFQATAPIYSSPVVEHNHVFFGSDDGNLYALRVGTGRPAWKTPVASEIRCRPAVAGERIFFGTKSGEFLSLDLSGQVKWRFKARRDILSSPTVHNGLVYVGSMDGHIYALGIENGWAGWKLQTQKPVVSSPCYSPEEDKLFVGSANGILYALEPGNGRERWKFNAGHQIASSPAYSTGAVYFGGNDSKIYCIDSKTGKERWSYKTGGPVPGSPTVADGVVFIGSTDQKLYAFKA